NTFSAAEIDIFKAVSEWIRAQTWTEGSTVKALVERLILEKCLRLDLISSKELLCTVLYSEIFAANSDTLDRFILVALRSKYQDTVADMRGTVENRFDGAPPLTRHRIGQPEGIVVQLGRPYRINCVRLRVDGCNVGTTCSYKVEQLGKREPLEICSTSETALRDTAKLILLIVAPYVSVSKVSMDRHNWVCVASNTRCEPFALHELIFDGRLVRYIRVLGVYNSSGDEYFSLIYFGALCSSEVVKRSDIVESVVYKVVCGDEAEAVAFYVTTKGQEEASEE
ncbi:unnamed protein product, partial [Heligmosomoides polygyrus]|uniref:BACK domain-containing protein n=1 Tax=Heligmosomoides polygyrus TaxID=6339 RepID=A0A183GS97_HELPZ